MLKVKYCKIEIETKRKKINYDRNENSEKNQFQKELILLTSYHHHSTFRSKIFIL